MVYVVLVLYAPSWSWHTCPKIGTSSIHGAQLSRVYLKAETESGLRSVVFWKINVTVLLGKDRLMDNVQKHNICLFHYCLLSSCRGTKCPQICSLATAVVLSYIYTVVTWQWDTCHSVKQMGIQSPSTYINVGEPQNFVFRKLINLIQNSSQKQGQLAMY
jgi:hypothetical protein